MIITNWPDKCPRCKSASFQILRPIDSKIEAEGWTPTNNKFVRFLCRGKICDHQWNVELVGVDPIVLTHRSYLPLAVVVDDEASAAEVLALDDTWATYKLSDLINRGAKRSSYVLERAEIESSQESQTVKPSGIIENSQNS